MSQELADRMAVAAGWKPSTTEGWWRDRNGVSMFAHPFPPGRIDPILDLMRERLEPMGWELFNIGWQGSVVEAMLIQHGCNTLKRTGPDLWTALASAVLGAMEMKT